jgi:hypothetical protein
LRRVVPKKYADVSEVLTASIIRTIAMNLGAGRTTETSVNFYETTRRNIPEGPDLQRNRELYNYELLIFAFYLVLM